MKSLTKNPIKKLLAVVTFVGAASTGAIAAPRTLANGAPAPGNTVAKGYTETPREIAASNLDATKKALVMALAEEKVAKTALTAQPRTLPNGSPACGNAIVKVCTAEMAESMYQGRIQRARTAELAVQRARVRVHEAMQKVALQRLGRNVVEDDYS